MKVTTLTILCLIYLEEDYNFIPFNIKGEALNRLEEQELIEYNTEKSPFKERITDKGRKLVLDLSEKI